MAPWETFLAAKIARGREMIEVTDDAAKRRDLAAAHRICSSRTRRRSNPTAICRRLESQEPRGTPSAYNGQLFDRQSAVSPWLRSQRRSRAKHSRDIQVTTAYRGVDLGGAGGVINNEIHRVGNSPATLGDCQALEPHARTHAR